MKHLSATNPKHSRLLELQETLWEMYVRDNLSQQEMCTRLNISNKTLIRYLNLCGLYSRKLNLERSDAESAN